MKNTPSSRLRPGSALRTLAALAALVAAVLAPVPVLAFDHGQWTTILQRYVDDAGHVAYRDLAVRDRATLNDYLRRLAAATEAPEEAAAKAF
ncbi:MAG: hypothetical protein HY271_02010 [Deltaproteobacteria bacterium]|nr:hypothetical protein [Deltaproteobacteria bacterium]